MLPTQAAQHQPSDTAEPTLGVVLTHFARTAVPAQLYWLLHLGAVAGVELGIRGYWRIAATGIAAASLGAWGLADRWLFTTPLRDGRKAGLIRYLRVVTGTVAAGTTLALLLELFLRLLGNAPIS